MMEKGFVMSVIIIVFSSRNFYIIIINDSLRKHPFLLALRRLRSPAAKREEKRMFLQATSMTALAMTTIFSLQKSILSSIVNCVTHNIVLYYSYQVLENDFQIILFFICFCISKYKLGFKFKIFQSECKLCLLF